MYEIKFISTAGNYFIFKDGNAISLDPNFKDGQELLLRLNKLTDREKCEKAIELIQKARSNNGDDAILQDAIIALLP